METTSLKELSLLVSHNSRQVINVSQPVIVTGWVTDKPASSHCKLNPPHIMFGFEKGEGDGTYTQSYSLFKIFHK